MKKTVLALVVALTVLVSFLAPASVWAAPSPQPTAPAAQSSVDTTAAPAPVSNSPQQLAQALVDARRAGAFVTYPAAIFDREILPVAQGQPNAGCDLDVRILQVLVLVVNRFGSVAVSDLQRPCIGSSLNCGPPTYSVHCVVPARAIDFASLGGVGLNGSNAQNVALLKFLDNVVPNDTNAGQKQCRQSAGINLRLVNIDEFTDSCNHQHVDFRNTDVPLNPAVLGPPLPTLAAASAYVTSLYNDYLSRTPSSSETNGWASQLVNGAPRDSVANGFVNSDEYRMIRIAAAYQGVLGRAPDPGGALDWLNAMRANLMTTDDIEIKFHASEEYLLQHGNTNGGFVGSLYTDLLHRTAGASEIAFWVNLVRQHGREWVVQQFWRSTETISERIAGMYQRYLGRRPDPAGLATWVGVALQIGDSGLRSALTSSDEYFARAQTRYGR